ncbi:MAG: hypothetical protein A2328_04215 [Bdellovibrionales bacterium RIFOXYB2_FULL_36_6]|nr:MAG: hypothetical protein A2328_04215 [Bdellovibrionales bacterium RIFOXYB2_FULL_36_6]OGS21429.1 MAG: hypothetical protein A2252_01195 [Elusimicrobia bacterium RIFOXYA2_FULL_39_19]
MIYLIVALVIAAVLLFLGVHIYIIRSLSADFNLTHKNKKTIYFSFLSLTALAYLPNLLFKNPAINVFLYFCAFWVGVVITAVFIFMIKDLLGFIFRSKKKLFVRISYAVILFILVFSIIKGARLPVVTEVNIPVSKYVFQKDFVIVQLSDLHLGPLMSVRWLEDVVKKVNLLDADIVVITGDLLDRSINDYGKYTPAFKNIKSRYGIYAVTGNHETESSGGSFSKLAREAGIRVLSNELIIIDKRIELAGVECTDYFNSKNSAIKLKKVFEKSGKILPLIFLSHTTDLFDGAAAIGADLQLSGHTHAGQIFPLEFFKGLIFDYSYGLYQKNGAYLYVTSGTGSYGTPMRFMSSPEIVKIVIGQKASD